MKAMRLTNLDASLYGFGLPVKAWNGRTGKIVGCRVGPARRHGGRRARWYYVALDEGGFQYYKARDLKPLGNLPGELHQVPIHADWKETI